MGIYLLEGTTVGVADNVFDVEKLEDLYDLTIWADQNNLRLNDIDGDDNMTSPHDDSENESEGPRTVEEHVNEWDKRNLSVDLYPRYYSRISENLSNKICTLFEDYMELIGLGKDTEYRPIHMDVLHSIRKSDSIKEHFDCFDYGIVFYVGATEDYSGGNLIFSDTGITLPMVPNRLLIIPSNLKHKVAPVESGTRVSMTTFVPVGPDWESAVE